LYDRTWNGVLEGLKNLSYTSKREIEVMSMKKPVKMETKDVRLVGRFGVANSAGVIDHFKDGPSFKTVTQAKEQAKIESAGGWLGSCWAVEFIEKC